MFEVAFLLPRGRTENTLTADVAYKPKGRCMNVCMYECVCVLPLG